MYHPIFFDDEVCKKIALNIVMYFFADFVNSVASCEI